MKVAISLPDAVFAAAEQLAEQMNVSRSQLYAQAISSYLENRGQVAVRERLDAVYATVDSRLDPALARLQARILDDEAW